MSFVCKLWTLLSVSQVHQANTNAGKNNDNPCYCSITIYLSMSFIIHDHCSFATFNFALFLGSFMFVLLYIQEIQLFGGKMQNNIWKNPLNSSAGNNSLRVGHRVHYNLHIYTFQMTLPLFNRVPAEDVSCSTEPTLQLIHFTQNKRSCISESLMWNPFAGWITQKT